MNAPAVRRQLRKPVLARLLDADQAGLPSQDPGTSSRRASFDALTSVLARARLTGFVDRIATDAMAIACARPRRQHAPATPRLAIRLHLNEAMFGDRMERPPPGAFIAYEQRCHARHCGLRTHTEQPRRFSFTRKEPVIAPDRG